MFKPITYFAKPSLNKSQYMMSGLHSVEQRATSSPQLGSNFQQLEYITEKKLLSERLEARLNLSCHLVLVSRVHWESKKGISESVVELLTRGR